MKEVIERFIAHVKEASANPAFVHHEWFVQYHLEIVERIARELLAHYPAADANLVTVLVWLHDYGKILDFDNQYQTTLSAGKAKLLELGFEPTFVDTAISYVETLDKKMEVDLHSAPIEIQIVSTADGCSHLVGPFFTLWWYENPGRGWQTLMQDNIKKTTKDWDRKIVLPEARKAFEQRHALLLERCGQLPDSFIK